MIPIVHHHHRPHHHHHQPIRNLRHQEYQLRCLQAILRLQRGVVDLHVRPHGLLVHFKQREDFGVLILFLGLLYHVNI